MPSFISQITLPNNNVYTIKDATARENAASAQNTADGAASAAAAATADIASFRQRLETVENNITSALHYIGETITVFKDGETNNPITIKVPVPSTTKLENGVKQDAAGNKYKEENYTANQGDVVWRKIGGEGDNIKEIEFVFNGTYWQEYGSSGTLKNLAFQDSASALYTPAGSVNVSVTPSTTKIKNCTNVGSVSKGTAPSFTATVNNENLTLSFSAGSVTSVTLPTFDATGTTVVTGISKSSGSFSGTPATITVS